MELVEAGGADPAEETAGEFGGGFFPGDFEFGEVPERIFISLLIETAVGGDAADDAGGLEEAEADREGGGDPFFRAFWAQGAGGVADDFAEAVGVLGAVFEGLLNCRAEGVEFGVGDAEFGGYFSFDLGAVAAAEEGEGEVGGGDYVGAATGGGEFVDFEVSDSRVGGFAGRAGTGEERHVGVDAGDGAGPAGVFEDGGVGGVF